MWKKEAVTDLTFLGSKITADSDCSQEIKRCLLLGRKAMTNVDSILKSTDITLVCWPSHIVNKVHVVKAMVFPVVMYGFETWTIKTECWRTDAFELWCWRRFLSLLDSKEIKPVNPKGNQLWKFIGRTDAEAPIFGHLMRRANSLEKTLMLGKTEGERRRGQQKKWLYNITDSMNMNWSKLWETMGDSGAWWATVLGGCKALDTT